MSEAATNSDIEDVLISIRRLISENPGDAEAPRKPAARRPERRPEQDKLVLTPALRVPDAKPPEERAEAPDAGAQARPSRPDTGARSELERRIAELESAISSAPDEWEPDGSEEAAAAPGPVFPDMQAKPQEAAEGHAAPTDIAEADFVEAVQDDDALDAEVIHYSAATMILEAEEIPDDADDGADATGTNGESRSDMAAGGTGAEAKASARAAAETEDAADEQQDEIVIDEDALRELVSQLVRSELKGRIGQRITRNIRRMVRREIKMALSVRDME